MIQLPQGFDAAALFSDLFAAAAPFVGISFVIAVGILICNYFKSIEF